MASETAARHPVEELLVFPATRPSPAAAETFAKWQEVVKKGLAGEKTGAMAMLLPHVSEDVVFKPPTYYKPWQGKGPFLLLIETVSEVFGSSFRYRREWISPDGRDWCLEFTALVQGKEVTGVDLVRLDEAGRIAHFEVLLRPPNAVAALKEEMMRRVPPKMAKLQEQMAASKL